MLKKSLFFALFCSILTLFSSCVEVVEEFWFSEDGSGRYSVTVDFSALLRDSVFSKRLEHETDSLRVLGLEMRRDSAFRPFEKWPDSLRKRAPRPELLRQIEGRVELDLDRKRLLKTIEFGFDSPRDFEQKMRAWRAASALVRPSAAGFGEPFFGALAPKIAFEGREASYFFDFSKTENAAVADIFSKKDDPFLSAFLRSAEHRVVLHFPKKIKRLRGEGFLKMDETTAESRRKWIDAVEGQPLVVRVKMRR